MSKSGWRGSYRQRQRIKRELAAVERVCWLGLEPLNFEQTDRTAGDFVVIDEEIPCAFWSSVDLTGNQTASFG